jgi:hypothetical protein
MQVSFLSFLFSHHSETSSKGSQMGVDKILNEQQQEEQNDVDF